MVLAEPPPEPSEMKPTKSSFHRPCPTQARTCLTLGAANLAHTLNPGPALTPPAQLLKPFPRHTCAGWAVMCWAVRTHPCHPRCPGAASVQLQRAQAYLHLSSLVLLEHKAEDVRVRPGQQAQVEGAVGHGELLEQHCKPNREGGCGWAGRGAGPAWVGN